MSLLPSGSAGASTSSVVAAARWPDYLQDFSTPEKGANIMDYEQHLAAEAAALRKDPLGSLLLLHPDVDWSEVRAARVHHTETAAEPAPAPAHARHDDYVTPCARVFSAPLVSVAYRHRANTTQPPPASATTTLLDAALPHEFAADHAAHKAAAALTVRGTGSHAGNAPGAPAAAPATAEILVQQGESTDLAALGATCSHRAHGDGNHRISLLAASARWSGGNGSGGKSGNGFAGNCFDRLGPDVVPTTTSPPGRQYLIKCTQPLDFALGKNLEPYFVSFALYDTAAKKRVSETFYADLNSDAQRRTLAGWLGDAFSDARCAPNFVLAVPFDPTNVVLVARVEKILERDPGRAVDAYCRPDGERSAAAFETLAKEVSQSAAAAGPRLAMFRTPLAWGAISLTDAAHLKGSPVLLELFAQNQDRVAEDDTFYKLIADALKTPDKRTLIRKQRRVPCNMYISVKLLDGAITAEAPRLLTPSLKRVAPWQDGAGVSLEVQTFSPTPNLTSHTAFRHNFYVYPMAANLPSSIVSNRNYACRISFHDTDEFASTGGLELQAGAQPVIYGRGTNDEKLTSVTAAVLYHNKTPTFYDEVKMALPTVVHKRHHVLFTFYHVSCKDGKPADKGEPKVAGYAFCPVMELGQVAAGEFNLPVAANLPPSYLMYWNKPSAKEPHWLDGGKGIFKVAFRLDSTVMSENPKVQNFLASIPPQLHLPDPHANTDFSATIRDCTRQLREWMVAGSDKPVPVYTEEVLASALPMLPMLLPHLTHLTLWPAEHGAAVGPEAFQALCALVAAAESVRPDGAPRSAVLATFVKYNFDIAGPAGRGAASPRLLHSELLPLLTAAITPAAGAARPWTDEEHRRVSATVTQHAWFFFELVTKSAALHLARTGLAASPRGRWHEDAFYDRLTALASAVCARVATEPPVMLPTTKQLAPTPAAALLVDFAFFLRDLLTLADRTRVFALIRHVFRMLHVGKQSSGGDASDLALARLELLRVLASHEHWVPLNLPRDTASTAALWDPGQARPLAESASVGDGASPQPAASAAGPHNSLLAPSLVQQHFLAGLMLHEISVAVQSPKADVRQRALLCLRQVLITHELDPRYPPAPPATDGKRSADDTRRAHERAAVLGRINNLYFPFVTLVFKYRGLLPKVGTGSEESTANLTEPKLEVDERREALALFFHILKSAERRITRRWWASLVPVDQCTFLALLTLGIETFEYPDAEVLKEEAKITAIKEALEGQYRVDTVLGAQDRRSRATSTVSAGVTIASANSLDAMSTSAPAFTANTTAASATAAAAGATARARPRTVSAVPEASAAALTAPRAFHRAALDSKTFSVVSAGSVASATSAISTASSRTLVPADDDRGSLAAISMISSPSTAGENRAHNQIRNKRRGEATEPTAEDLQRTRMARGLLSTEHSLLVLDLVEFFVEEFVAPETSINYDLIDAVFTVHYALLRARLSQYAVVQHMSALACLVQRFEALIFEGSTERCATLCGLVFRHCGAPLQPIREAASRLMYLLMARNFEYNLKNNDGRGEFMRVRVQATIALSAQASVSTDSVAADTELALADATDAADSGDDALARSLGTIIKYARADQRHRATAFPGQVENLAVNLCGVLRNTAQIRRHRLDPLMTLDLQWYVANGYRGNPDLRLQWLVNMATTNGTQKCFVEAAQCCVHAAALISEVLNARDHDASLPTGYTAFEKISCNVGEEATGLDFRNSQDQEGSCNHHLFSKEGLIGLLQQAQAHFNAAGMPEAVHQVLKLIAPIHEMDRNFGPLGDVYGKMRQACTDVVKLSAGNKRFLGSYFRVAFYGKSFFDPAICDKQFIYKEPGLTTLADFSLRMKEKYTHQFDRGVLEMITDSKPVVKSALDPLKAYIQITFVTPHFVDTDSERKARPTFYERNTQLGCFVFETPFTKGAKAHGSLEDQYIMRTFLTTERAFPYLKTRIEVTEVRTEELTPIQVAIANLERKLADLDRSLAAHPVDLKLLQLQLQGSVSVSVNEGPGQIAAVFLGDSARSKEYPDQHTKKLRALFVKFLHACERALVVNKQHITANQQLYHESLVAGFETTRSAIHRVAGIGGAPVPASKPRESVAALTPQRTPSAQSLASLDEAVSGRGPAFFASPGATDV